MGTRTLIKSILFIFVFVVLFLSQFLWNAASSLDPDRIRILLSDMGMFAPAVYIVFMALAVIISPIPSLPLDIAAGAFFGPFLGTVYSVIGAEAGAIMSFLIARFLGRELIVKYIKGHINFCRVCSDKLLTKVVFFSRLLPFVSFDIVSYGAGLTQMSLARFALATFLGVIPLTFVYNYFGSVLIFGGMTLVITGLVMVLLFFLIPGWIERYDLLSMKKYFTHDDGAT